MKNVALHKFLSGFAKVLALFITCCMPLSGISGNTSTNWTPAYSDEQLDIINNTLGKWKPDSESPTVKDVFRDRSYEPNWSTVKADATPWDMVPGFFNNEQEAVKAGCQSDYLKTTEKKTCLLKFVSGQGAWIFVYDQDASGKYIRSGVITPPTWYGFASVALVDIFGPDKPKFILIEHQGDSGTGTDEKVHWLLGWHDGAFHTVLRETVYLMVDGLGDQTFYQMNYRIIKGKVPHIETHCRYEQVAVTATPYDFHSSWQDWFFWNEKEFSFYNTKVENEQIQNGALYNELRFRLNLETNRAKILKLLPLPHDMWDYESVEKYWNGIANL